MSKQPEGCPRSLDDRLDVIETVVNDIKVALLGTDYGQPGLVQRQQQTEERLSAVESQVQNLTVSLQENRRRLMIFGLLAVSGSGALGANADKLFSLLS